MNTVCGNNKILLLHLEYSQDSSTSISFLERRQGTRKEKLQNVWFGHTQQHGAKILWVTMYQAANDSKERVLLTNFPAQSEIHWNSTDPVWFPQTLKPEPRETVTDHSQTVSICAATNTGCAHACIYIHVSYTKANIFTYKVSITV